MADVFEGDNNDMSSCIAEDLDLFAVATRTMDLWKLPERTAHHIAIDLVISKGLSYDMYTKVRNNIKNAIGKREYSQDTFKFTDKKLKEWGISGEKINAIRKILQLETVDSGALCRIKECGLHIVKAFKVFFQEHDDTFLNEDYNVRTNMGILFCKNKLMTPQEATRVAKNWNGHRSIISYFLHRLKPTSAYKILDQEELDDNDFYEIK
jgi:3-methyladenine DNA glycosylase/8-oxoguanine DNA glycosylase